MSRLVVLVQSLGTILQWLLSLPVRALRGRLGWAAHGWRSVRDRPRPVREAVPPWAHRPGYFVLSVLAGALLLVLRQMHLTGAPSGSALSFPLWFGASRATGAAQALRQAWLDYAVTLPSTRELVAAHTLVRHIMVIDLVFVAVYGVLLAAGCCHGWSRSTAR